MEAPVDGLARIKEELKSGHASQFTLHGLQSLLKPENAQPSKSSKTSQPGRTKPAPSGQRSKSTIGPKFVKDNGTQSVRIHEDVSQNLPAREQYALATETVNICLKALSDLAKRSNKTQKINPAANTKLPSTPPSSNGKASASDHALQPRSVNASPVRSSPTKLKIAAPDANYTEPVSIEVVAECAHLAFSFLRTANTKNMNVRAMPKLQLETGMLALVNSLIVHGLDSLAFKELRIVKNNLEALASPRNKPTKDPKSSTKVAPEKETLASLLHLKADFDSCPEALPVAINYLLQTLRIICNSRKPAIIESALPYLSLDQHNSPADLITRQSKHSGDPAKAAKQLESMAQSILNLCPGVNGGDDEKAKDPAQSPAPAVIFALQALALQIRQSWWELVKHEADVGKELLEPFSRCATALIRRLPSPHDPVETYELMYRSFDALCKFDSKSFGSTLFNIHYILSTQAELAGKDKAGLEWTARMVEDCSDLEQNNARRIASLLREVTLQMKQGATEEVTLDRITSCFESSLTGNGGDYEVLMTALGGLTRLILSARQRSHHSVHVERFLRIFASFALRYSRSYPGKATNHVYQIIDTALRLSASTDDLMSWVTEEAAQMFVRAGILRAVADVARTKPLSEAWKASGAAISLSRILRALILKGLRGGVTSNVLVVSNEDQLEPDERGTVLEHHLKFAIELAPKTKYHDGLSKLIPDLLLRLSKCYTAAEFPLRRARVAAATFRLRESHTELVPPHIFKIWRDYNPPEDDEYASDSGLAAYYSDLKAGIQVLRAFSSGRPTEEDLKPSLTLWEKILDDCDNGDSLRSKIEDPATVDQQLKSFVAYFDVLGDANAALHCQMLQVKLNKMNCEDGTEFCIALLGLARRYGELGHAVRASEVLEQASVIAQEQEISVLAKCHWHILRAEYLIATNNLDGCRVAIEAVGVHQARVQHEANVKDDRKSLELIDAQACLLRSKYMLEIGSPHVALEIAKRSVRSLNSTWTALSRSSGKATLASSLEGDESSQAAVKGLTQGIKKLQLTPTDPSESDETIKSNKRGATFWPLVPVICRAMVHLSEMYAHHGRFSEANYYSEHAIQIAESVQSSCLVSWLRISRSRFLTLAGRLEEAELCLNQMDTTREAASIDAVERFCAMAGIRVKEASLDEAMTLYEKAEQILDELTLTVCGVANAEDLATVTSRPHVAENRRTNVGASARQATKPRQKIVKTGTARQKPGRSDRKAKALPLETASEQNWSSSNWILSNLKAKVLLGKTIVSQMLGRNIETLLPDLGKLQLSTLDLFRRTRIQYTGVMQTALAVLQMDVTFNVLVESTLSMPATILNERRTSGDATSPATTSIPAKTVTKGKRSDTKVTKSKTAPDSSFEELFMTARHHLMSSHLRTAQFDNTAQTHLECAMLSNVNLLLSATSKSQLIEPASAALAIDLPRIKAAEYERKALLLDATEVDNAEKEISQGSRGDSFSELSAAQFQELYIDIIPKSWTAVSLCLSEDANELYIVRYRSGQAPFVLRLPFSRHKPGDDLDEDDEEVFDYHHGKAQLNDIIELSNYSCHNNGNSEAKGKAKTWWNEREALDRRLQELLINMENIWFGGFKSIFSASERRQDLLIQFKKSFEEILERYLPSRKAVKAQAERLIVDDQVLELFVALGQGEDGEVDVDVPLTDLLYFVVDMLQFSGERNAYDEIDFDSMAVDVHDAIRIYHDSSENGVGDAQHLVLVLDRRLQAFPWESLPFLQDTSVSRVGSMLSLRERILAMRGCHKHVVHRTSGTYILNPSADLKATQSTLQPALSTLSNGEGAEWTAIVNQEPDEDRFKSALSNDSMLLYFGHGGGSQYIRPRSVKRLDKCSEVVWLMGCSSGAVTEYGDLEPFAIPLAYLQAGYKPEKDLEDQVVPNSECMAVVATLWDVTDKDIDRFSLALGEEWGLWPMSEHPKLPTKTPKKREVIAHPSTPQRLPKTPKTPKALKTPIAAKTPARSRSRLKKDDGDRSSLVRAVARSRDACYLRYLNGAAAVVYGVPVYLGD